MKKRLKDKEAERLYAFWWDREHEGYRSEVRAHARFQRNDYFGVGDVLSKPERPGLPWIVHQLTVREHLAGKRAMLEREPFNRDNTRLLLACHEWNRDPACPTKILDYWRIDEMVVRHCGDDTCWHTLGAFQFDLAELRNQRREANKRKRAAAKTT